MKVQHCLTLLFCSSFNVGEFPVPQHSSPGPVPHSTKVRFHFSCAPPVPEAPLQQEDISVQPQAQPEQSTHMQDCFLSCIAGGQENKRCDVLPFSQSKVPGTTTCCPRPLKCL